MVKTLTRSDLADALYKQVGLSRVESAELIDSVLNHISKALIAGDTVKIASYGSFFCRDKDERMGRNPKTGEEVPISPRRIPVFHASQILKAQVNHETIDGLRDELDD